ncbi:MAG: CDP-alcohol phosphatidyltransferase family protein, partial [Solirubrobacteraceae bacterium]
RVDVHARGGRRRRRGGAARHRRRGDGGALMGADTHAPASPTEPSDPPRRPPRPLPNRLEVLRDRLIASRLTPNQISMAGFTLNVIAAVLVWQHEFFIGGVVFIVGSVCDTLDGGYSRMSGKGTPFGAFLDSTLDRIVEGIVLTAVAATFTQRGDELAVAAVVVAVMSSLVVSYTRARAEALGVECKVGIADRLVRVIILSAGLVFADLGALEPAVYVLAALSTVTVVQRILHVKGQLTQAPV